MSDYRKRVPYDECPIYIEHEPLIQDPITPSIEVEAGGEDNDDK